MNLFYLYPRGPRQIRIESQRAYFDQTPLRMRQFVAATAYAVDLRGKLTHWGSILLASQQSQTLIVGNTGPDLLHTAMTRPPCSARMAGEPVIGNTTKAIPSLRSVNCGANRSANNTTDLRQAGAAWRRCRQRPCAACFDQTR